MKIKFKNIAKITLLKGLFMLFLFVGETSFSQTTQNLDEDDEIIAKGKGERTIVKSKKVSFAPNFIEDTTQKQIKQDYVFYDYTAPSEFTTEKIKPARLKIVDPLDKLYGGYLKAGVGMYLSPLVDFYYGSKRSRENNWGVNYSHFSSNTGIKDLGFSGLSNNHGNVFYKHFLRDLSIKGKVSYDRNVNYFYGFKEADTIIDKEIIKQRFNTIGAKISVASYKKDSSEWNYNGDLGFRNHNDLLQAKENNFVLRAFAQKQIDDELFGGEFSIDVNNYKRNNAQLLTDTILALNFIPSQITTNNTIVKIAPHIITNRGKLQAKVGLGIFIDIGSNSKFYFAPNAEFKYSFLDIFIPYVGIKGGVKRNSFYSLSKENPFILSDVSIQNTHEKYNIYGGVRGSISNTISFNLGVSKAKLNGVPFYFNDTSFSIENKFDVTYDLLDVFGFSGQVSYQKGEKLNIYLKGEYNLYSPLVEQKAWNMPAVDITLGGVYNLANKIFVRGNIFFIGNRKAKSLTFVEGADIERGEYIVNLPAFFDFNLGFEYRYTKRISAFLNFNNIISKKYQMYHKYPVQGINILGGATFSF